MDWFRFAVTTSAVLRRVVGSPANAMRAPILTFISFLFLGTACAGTGAILPRETEETRVEGYVGLPVAVFQARTTSGGQVSSKDFNGKVLLIDLWGLNCVSCLYEMRALEGLYEDYRDKGLVIWALNTEMIGAREILEGLRSRDVDVSYDLLMDPDLEITKKFTSWFIPVTVIVDSDGVVQYYKVGFKEADIKAIRAKVGVLLGE